MDLDHAGSRSGAFAQGREGLRLSDLERTLLGTVAWVPPRGCGSGLLRSCEVRPRRNLRGVSSRSPRPTKIPLGGCASDALLQGALGASRVGYSEDGPRSASGEVDYRPNGRGSADLTPVRQHYLQGRALGGPAPGPNPAAESPSGRERMVKMKLATQSL